MFVTRAAAVAAVLGGLVWVVAAVLDWGAGVDPVAYLVGLGGFLLALAGLGYTLVDHAPVWLRAIVLVATPVLGYAVWITVADAFDNDSLPVLGAGVALLLAGGAALARRSRKPVQAPVRGHRAAR